MKGRVRRMTISSSRLKRAMPLSCWWLARRAAWKYLNRSPAHAIGNHHTIVARQDFARFLDSILLEFAQFHHRAGAGRSILCRIEIVSEVLEDGFHIDLVGSVGPAPEFGGVEQVDQCLLEVTGSLPLPLVPRGQFVDGQDAG